MSQIRYNKTGQFAQLVIRVLYRNRYAAIENANFGY